MGSLVTGDETIYNDWNYPWQFHLSLSNQRIQFGRHSVDDNTDNRQYFVESSKVEVSSGTWTHVAVTWDHATGSSTIYVDGKNVGYRKYPPRKAFFYEPTGMPYKIGNDGHQDDHQFHGSVMDLYVFGTALSLDQINKRRGWCANHLLDYFSFISPALMDNFVMLVQELKLGAKIEVLVEPVNKI